MLYPEELILYGHIPSLPTCKEAMFILERFIHWYYCPGLNDLTGRMTPYERLGYNILIAVLFNLEAHIVVTGPCNEWARIFVCTIIDITGWSTTKQVAYILETLQKKLRGDGGEGRELVDLAVLAVLYSCDCCQPSQAVPFPGPCERSSHTAVLMTVDQDNGDLTEFDCKLTPFIERERFPI